MSDTFQNIPPTSGGGGGAVDSVNGQTGTVIITKASIGLANVNNTSDANKPVSTAQAAADAAVQAFSIQRANHTGTQDISTIDGGSNNGIAGFDGSGVLRSIPGLVIDTTSGGINSNLTVNPNNLSTNYFDINLAMSVDPLQDSPSDLVTMFYAQASLDVNNSGFDFGTGGQSVNAIALNVTHAGTGDIGGVDFLKSTFDIGNGTDPITMRGLGYAYGFGQIHDNVTLVGPMQGYGFQPALSSGAIVSSGSYTLGFYDSANAACSMPGWTSFNASPNIAEIQNNTNYAGLNISANIPLFTGNAGFTGIGIYGNYGSFGTGGFNGIQINPTVTSVVNATGLSINMNNITASGTKRALDVTGDVFINGALSFSGALSIGQLQAFYASVPIDGGGNPQTLHGLITQMTAQNGTTVANGDAIGVNTAMLINLEANSVTTSGPFKLGFSALALPCVVETHTGSSLDYMSGATFALNLSGASTGGTIDNVNISRTVAIPNGITTVTNLRGFYFDLPFGDPGTTTWGMYMEPDVHNYLQGNLLIGGTAGSDDTVTNDSVALEIKSSTKAALLSRMTNTERDALIAVNGMIIYSTTDSKIQAYAAGAWVNLH